MAYFHMILPAPADIIYHASGTIEHRGILKSVSEVVTVYKPVSMDKDGSKLIYETEYLEGKINRQLLYKHFNTYPDRLSRFNLNYVILSPLNRTMRAIVCEEGGHNGSDGFSRIYCGRNGAAIRPIMTQVGIRKPHAMFQLYKEWEIIEVRVIVSLKERELEIRQVKYNGAFDIDSVPILKRTGKLEVPENMKQYEPAVDAAIIKAYNRSSYRPVFYLPFNTENATQRR